MARPTLARRLGTAALLTTLALSTAACGSDSGASTGTDTSASGEESSSEEAPESSGDLQELDGAEFYPAVMQALQDAGSFAFTMSSSTEGSDAGGMEMQGVMRYGDDGVDMQATGTGQGSDDLEMIMLDKVLYMSGVGMDLGDKKWLKVDMSDPDSLFGMLGKSTDPETMFKAMQKPQEFELLGTEEVDGVETNHYKIVMDTAAYVDAMDMPAELATSMPDDIGVEMWVDADNLPRQFHQKLEIPGIAGGQATSSTTEGTYSDYGTDVTIEAPPASEVTDKMPGM
ncbi:hypothetical protein [Nocardioides sp. P5_C9_2]